MLCSAIKLITRCLCALASICKSITSVCVGRGAKLQGPWDWCAGRTGMGFFQALMCSVGFCPGGILALIFFIIHFLSLKKNKTNTNHLHVSIRGKKKIFNSFITTEVNRQLLISLWNRQGKKKKKNLSNVSHWRTSLFCFLAYFYFKKEYIIEDFSTGCKGVLFLVYLICRK